MQAAYKCLSRIAVGLPDGRTVVLREGDYVPPSLLPGREYQLVQWLANGTVISVPSADVVRVAQADAAAAPQPVTPRISISVDGFSSPVGERGYVSPVDERFTPGSGQWAEGAWIALRPEGDYRPA